MRRSQIPATRLEDVLSAGFRCAHPSQLGEMSIASARFFTNIALVLLLASGMVHAAGTVVGFVYVGPWDDYGYNLNVLFIVGLALAPLLAFVLRQTRWGLVVRTVSDSHDAALALGFHVNRVRALCTMIGGFLAGGRLVPVALLSGKLE
jgi:general nucleoside transport system permease protein